MIQRLGLLWYWPAAQSWQACAGLEQYIPSTLDVCGLLAFFQFKYNCSQKANRA